MSLKAFRAAVVQRLRDALPGVDVKPGPGRFTAESVKTFMLKAPAMRVGVLAYSRARPRADMRLEIPVTMAIYIVTRDTAEETRDDAVLRLVEEVSDLVDREPFQSGEDDPIPFRTLLNAGGDPRGAIEARNLYDSDAQGQGVSMWVLTFVQVLVVGTPSGDFEDTYPLGPDVDEPFPLNEAYAHGPYAQGETRVRPPPEIEDF